MLLSLFQENLEKFKKNLSDQMEKASEELDFEKAAILRDRINLLNIIQSYTKS